MSNTILAKYKTSFSKALDTIVEDLRMSEDEVQELLTWMTRATRSRIFRPAQYVEDKVQSKERDSTNFEAVFIPDLDELDTQRPKEKKNEANKPATGSKPSASKSLGNGVQKVSPPIKAGVTGGSVAKGSTKPPVPKLVGIRSTAGGTKQKAKATSKVEKATVKSAPTGSAATKTTTVKQVPIRPSGKPVQAATKPNKPKN